MVGRRNLVSFDHQVASTSSSSSSSLSSCKRAISAASLCLFVVLRIGVHCLADARLSRFAVKRKPYHVSQAVVANIFNYRDPRSRQFLFTISLLSFARGRHAQLLEPCGRIVLSLECNSIWLLFGKSLQYDFSGCVNFAAHEVSPEHGSVMACAAYVQVCFSVSTERSHE